MVSNDEVDPADAVSSAEVEVSDNDRSRARFLPGGLVGHGSIKYERRHSSPDLRRYSSIFGFGIYMVRWCICFKAQERYKLSITVKKYQNLR